jgi:thiol-disulfide isomerase/thioredoxin
MIAESAWLAVAVVLTVAAVAKLRDRAGFAAAVAGYQILPRRLAPVTARLVIGLELVSAAALVVPASRRGGAVAALVLFGGFLAAMSVALRRGLRVDCGCFPRSEPSLPIGPASLTRTGLLLVLAAIAAAAPGPPGPPGPPFWPTQVAVAAGALVIVAGATWLAGQLSGNDSEDEPTPTGPPPGTQLVLPVPVASVSDGSGPVVFGYISPHCPSCQALLPALAELAEHHRVVLVSAFPEAEVSAYLAAHGISLPLLTGPDVLEANEIPWPPYAIVTTNEGVVLSQGSIGTAGRLEQVLGQANLATRS